MSHWNHRVLAHQEVDRIVFCVHEVYYDENGKPNGYTENPVSMGFDELEALEWTIDKMKLCLEKEILWEGDRFPEVYEPIIETK